MVVLTVIDNPVILARQDKSNPNSFVGSCFRGRIAGSIKKLGWSLDARVILLNRQTFENVATTVSKSGSYEFNSVPIATYVVIAFDPDSQYNAVIQDNVVPK
jgi:hypothetical protein